MRIHFIAIGGSIMHALAIDARERGHIVTGSDDEIYEPSRSRLQRHGLLPPAMGWFPERIGRDIDLVILGMHARKNNPELIKALTLGIRTISFPEFISEMSGEKTRVVIAGSHGKTTTTSMVMHVLRHCGMPFDYLVGARLEGFDNMARLSDAPVIVIEGDEYLSSALDRRPKFLHYYPEITVLTGIEWDHMNVFPTKDNYIDQFRLYIHSLPEKASIFYYKHDVHLQEIFRGRMNELDVTGYEGHPCHVEGESLLLDHAGGSTPVSIFGQHNMENLQAAKFVCLKLGVTEARFYEAITSFRGAQKRLQELFTDGNNVAYLDFAHAPSKVRATVGAVADKHPDRQVVACLELHTYSSLNAAFIPQYRGTLSKADESIVYFDHHTIAMKKLPPLDPAQVEEAFGGQIHAITQIDQLERTLRKTVKSPAVILFMSSGNFHQTDLIELSRKLFTSS